MKIIQSPSFKKTIKKFKKNLKLALDEEIRCIMKKPGIGEEKKGDLQGVYVHKFKFHIQEYLLSYRFQGENLELITIGSHENYYYDKKLFNAFSLTIDNRQLKNNPALGFPFICDKINS